MGLPGQDELLRRLQAASIEKKPWSSELRNPKAYYTSPYIHTVTLKGLSGFTTYHFTPAGSTRQVLALSTVSSCQVLLL